MTGSIHPDIECLRRIRILSQFDDSQMLELASELCIETAPANHCLVEQGCNEQYSLYLIQGSLSAVSADGERIEYQTEPKNEIAPIAQLRPSMYEVTSVDEVSFLRIYSTQLTRFAQQLAPPDSGIEVIEFEQTAEENKLTIRLFQELMSGNLNLPSLPEVAQRIQQAFGKVSVDAEAIGNIIQSDPVITAKLIKIANSALYRGSNPIDSLQQAIVRMGLETTRKQVMMYAVKELFDPSSSEIEERMNLTWKHSQQVACLSRILAEQNNQFDPDQALLAGLVHDLGEIAILQFIHQNPSLGRNPDLVFDAINSLRPLITGMLLSQWNFGDEFITVGEESESWFRNPGEKADLCDLVLIAQYHSFIGTPAMHKLPPVPSLPAFAKLGMNHLDPQSIMDFIKQSQNELEAIEAQLALI